MQNVTFNSCSHFTIIFTIVVPLAELSLSNVADFCFYIQILDSCCSFDSDIIFFFPKLIIFIAFSLNPFENGLFQDCSWIEGDGGGGWKKGPLFLKFITQMMKLAVIPYPKLYMLYLTLHKKYINYVMKPLSSADISIFLPEHSNFCYIRNTDIDQILIHNF